MTNFLDSKRQEIASRLAELAPQVQEYERLEAAVKVLDAIPASPNGASAAKPRPTGRRRGPGRPRRSKSASPPAAAVSASSAKPTGKTSRGRRKGSGKRAVQALALIQGQPGITIPELAAKMGTHQTYLYKVVPGLEQNGRIRKEGRGWHPTAKAVA